MALVADNGPCFRGNPFTTFSTAVLAGLDPLLRHTWTRVRTPQGNGVVERFFGTLKHEHLYRAIVDDGGALAVEAAPFRQTCNTSMPHQALADRTLRDACRSPPELELPAAGSWS